MLNRIGETQAMHNYLEQYAGCGKLSDKTDCKWFMISCLFPILPPQDGTCSFLFFWSVL